MQTDMKVTSEFLEMDSPDEELIDTLIAISVVSKRLAQKLRTLHEKGEKDNAEKRAL